VSTGAVTLLTNPFQNVVYRLVLALICLLLVTEAKSARPEPPALIRDIHLVDDGEFLEPYLPAMRALPGWYSA